MPFVCIANDDSSDPTYPPDAVLNLDNVVAFFIGEAEGKGFYVAAHHLGSSRPLRVSDYFQDRAEAVSVIKRLSSTEGLILR